MKFSHARMTRYLVLVVEMGVLVLHRGELGVGAGVGAEVREWTGARLALVFGKVATLKTARATFTCNSPFVITSLFTYTPTRTNSWELRPYCHSFRIFFYSSFPLTLAASLKPSRRRGIAVVVAACIFPNSLRCAIGDGKVYAL